MFRVRGMIVVLLLPGSNVKTGSFVCDKPNVRPIHRCSLW